MNDDFLNKYPPPEMAPNRYLKYLNNLFVLYNMNRGCFKS